MRRTYADQVKLLRFAAPCVLSLTLLVTLASCGGETSVTPLQVSQDGPAAAPTATQVSATPTAPEPTPEPSPTATEVPPTATPVPPTATAVPPTATAVPPTATPLPTPEATVEESNPDDTQTEGDVDPDDTQTEGDVDPDDTQPPAAEVNLELGTSVFQTSCASCHATDGSGTTRGPSILGIGAFFPDDASPLTNLVTNGGVEMPAFGTRLSSEEIAAVVEYVVVTFQ